MSSRNLIVAKLDAARQLVSAYFEPPGCTWEGRYHAEQEECGRCVDAAVCGWIFAQDPAPNLARFSESELIEALVFASGFLEGQMFHEGHDAQTCPCRVCAWVRDVNEFSGQRDGASPV